MNIWKKIEQAYMITCRATDHLGVATNQGESQPTEDLLQRLTYAQGDLESALSTVKDVQQQLLQAAGQ